MQALYLNIKNRSGGNINTVMSLYEVCKLSLFGLLDVDKAAEYCLVICVLFKCAEFVKISYPFVTAEKLGD